MKITKNVSHREVVNRSKSLCTKNTALDSSSLYFDQQLIEKIVRHTNEYAHIAIMNKSTHADKGDAWVEMTPQPALIHDSIYRRSSCQIHGNLDVCK